MKIFYSFKSALLSIRTKKVRSFLTMLGIIIGVSQIIALIGLGEGIKKDITSEVTQLGSNILFVLSGKVQTSQGRFNPAATVGASTLTEDDLSAIKQMPDIVDATPIGLMAAVPATASQTAQGTMVIAVEPSFFSYTTIYKLTSGRFFTQEENDQAARVINIGKDAQTALFPTETPASVLGKIVNLGKEPFTIVGVYETAETSALMTAGGSSPGMVAVPFATAKSVNANTQIFRIGVKAEEGADVKIVAKELQAKLTELHGTDDTTVFTQEDLLNVVDSILGLITKAIVGLASISLIVGGIGIMNIMLVAVTERTKEIGLRKAVGATRGNILMQFLTESVVLSLIGGAVGVGLVTVASILVKQRFGLTILVDARSVLTALGFAFFVGVIFGIAPAIRAARKDPIEALRYE